jgi:hypothetical protein
MKLSDAMQNIIGVCYKTAWNIWKPGELDAYQLPSGTIIVKNNINTLDKREIRMLDLGSVIRNFSSMLVTKS